MKRTISTLALAAPLATVALSLGSTPAMAQPADPIDELKIAEIAPDIPEDDLPQPEDPDKPNLPGDKDGPPQCPLHGECGDGPDDEKDPGDEDGDDGDGDEKDPDDGDDFKKPNRIDAGAGANDGGMELAWLMAGGGLITATGAAYAVRRRSSMGA
jgi:hypothetical protein